MLEMWPQPRPGLPPTGRWKVKRRWGASDPRLLSVPFLFRQIWPTPVLLFTGSYFSFFTIGFAQRIFYIRSIWFPESPLWHVKVRGPVLLSQVLRDTTNTGHWSAIDWSAVSDNAAPLAVVFAGWERYRSQSEKKVKVRFKCFCPSDLACLMDNDE